MKLVNWVFIIYQIIILFLVFGSSITFGNGLGDLGMIMVYGIVLLILITLNIWAIRKEKLNGSRFLLYLSFCFGLISVLTLTLYFTIWRGPEYPWNRKVFFSSSYQNSEYSKEDSILNANNKIATDKIRADPNDIKAYIDRARVSKSSLKYEEAIKDYKKALEINDSNLSANLEIGEVYWDLENYEVALKYNEKALSLDTSYFLAKHRVKMLKEEIAKHSH